MLPGDVGANQSADAGRIHVRDLGEINDQRARSIGAHRGLELKHCCHYQRTVEAQNALSGLRSGLIFYAEGLLRHAGNINRWVTDDC